MIQAGSIEELSLDKACLTIGSFDGVHLGHQKLISILRRSAEEIGAPSVVLTFHPHPIVVLKNLKTPFYLSTPEEKAEQFARLGVDILVSIPFTYRLADMSAEEFTQLLTSHLGLKRLVVGCGFVLGKGRIGTVDVLSTLGKQTGFEVRCIDAEMKGGEVISSSLIRRQIEEGDVQSAALGLGRNFTVHGKVIKGDGRGRTIGFPTANLDIWPKQLLPAVGVYRCLTLYKGQTYLSVANLGYRPTFTDNVLKIFTEIHLLDYSGDLYGEELQVQFTHRLRGETKFPSFRDLVNQINRDITAAREL
jgi:riboflavin kinase / FMN adenylyltransferase